VGRWPVSLQRIGSPNDLVRSAGGAIPAQARSARRRGQPRRVRTGDGWTDVAALGDAGVRYTHEAKDIDNAGGLYGFKAPYAPVSGSVYGYSDSIANNTWIPKFGLEMKLPNGALAYVSATRGFKSGGFNLSSTVPGRGYDPEWVWSYEGGWKGTLMGGRSRLSTSAFVIPDHPLGGDDDTAVRGQLRVVFDRRTSLLLSSDVDHQTGIPLTYNKVLVAKPGFQFDNPPDFHDVRSSLLAWNDTLHYGGSARLTMAPTPATTLVSLTAYRNLDYEFFADSDSTELDLFRTHQLERQHCSRSRTKPSRTPRSTASDAITLSRFSGPLTRAFERSSPRFPAVKPADAWKSLVRPAKHFDALQIEEPFEHHRRPGEVHPVEIHRRIRSGDQEV
jgi:TonB dependent receptor-like, beta-barrel